MKHKISFEEDGHVYHVDGRPVLSVTQVLDIMGLYGSFMKRSAQHYRDFGTAVHKACALYVKGMVDPADPEDWGRLDPDATHPRVLTRVSGYKKFLAHTGFRPKLVEHLVTYRGLLAGTLDAWGPDKEARDLLVDIKASASKDPAYELQTAAYGACLEYSEGLTFDERICVHLTKDDFRVAPHTNSLDLGRFMAALSLAQWKLENKVV